MVSRQSKAKEINAGSIPAGSYTLRLRDPKDEFLSITSSSKGRVNTFSKSVLESKAFLAPWPCESPYIDILSRSLRRPSGQYQYPLLPQDSF